MHYYVKLKLPLTAGIAPMEDRPGALCLWQSWTKFLCVGNNLEETINPDSGYTLWFN